MSPRRVFFGAATAFFALAFNGCSMLVTTTSLHSDRDDPAWPASPLKDAKAKHPGFMKYTNGGGDLAVTLCAMPLVFSIAGIGPPVVPIVPGILFTALVPDMGPLEETPGDRLLVPVHIQSSSDAEIDLSMAALRVDGASGAVHPIEVYRDKAPPSPTDTEVCGRRYDQFPRAKALQRINGGADLAMAFPVPKNDVKAFELDLGSVRVGGKEKAIPPLRYRRERFRFYVPLVIPPEGKPIGPIIF